MKIKIKQIILTIAILLTIICSQQIGSIALEKSTSIAPPPTGWQNINGDFVILALPASYQGGKPSIALDKIESILKSVSPDVVDRLDLIRQNKDYVALLAIDPDSTASMVDAIDNVSVTFTKASRDLTFEKYLEKTRSQLASKYEIEESNVLVSPDKILKRIVAKTTIADRKIAQAIYLQELKEHDRRFWSITYSTTNNKLASQLPTFDRSAATLQFLQKT